MVTEPKDEETQVSVRPVPSPDELEKLGRQRPPAFTSAWGEFGFCFSVLVSVLMADYFISGFHTVLPAVSIALSIPPTSRTWPSSVLSLVAGAFLLPLGRVADMYGGYLVFNIGFVWFTLWSLIAGFSTSYPVLILCRAMEGLGAAAFLPAGIMLLGRVYRPGPRKNFIFAMYGAICPIGFFFGIFMGGLSDHVLSWRWYFWLGTLVSVPGCLVSLLAIPRDRAEVRSLGIKMDWWGSATLVPGLLLFVFALTNSSQAPRGWATPYIYVTFVLGVLLLAMMVYVEGWVAASPLIPSDIFRVRYMKRMALTLFIIYGVFGVFLYYTNFYIELVLGVSPFVTALWFAPWAGGGIILAATSGFLLHLVPGRWILVMCGIFKIIAVLLFALMPESPNYWASVFPAMVAETACVDVIYTVTNVFITTNLPSHRQGLAGAFINCTLFVGICVYLGIADIAVGNAAHLGLAGSYKVAFWIGVGFSSLALLVFLTMDIGSAKSDLTQDEKIALEDSNS